MFTLRLQTTSPKYRNEMKRFGLGRPTFNCSNRRNMQLTLKRAAKWIYVTILFLHGMEKVCKPIRLPAQASPQSWLKLNEILRSKLVLSILWIFQTTSKPEPWRLSKISVSMGNPSAASSTDVFFQSNFICSSMLAVSRSIHLEVLKFGRNRYHKRRVRYSFSFVWSEVFDHTKEGRRDLYSIHSAIRFTSCLIARVD